MNESIKEIEEETNKNLEEINKFCKELKNKQTNTLKQMEETNKTFLDPKMEIEAIKET